MFVDLTKITHIIFDWDGTIMDSAAKIVRCMQEAALLCALPIPSTKSVEHIIGISLMPAVQQLFNIDTQRAEVFCNYYRQIFVEQEQTACTLFDGAHDVLDALSQKYTLGVATGKARRGLHRAFTSSKSEHFFDQSICADEALSKPSPDMLNQLLKRWNVVASRAVMIGDTIYDMKMAEQISMPRIGVSYGVHEKQALLHHNPLAVIDRITDLHKLFQTNQAHF